MMLKKLRFLFSSLCFALLIIVIGRCVVPAIKSYTTDRLLSYEREMVSTERNCATLQGLSETQVFQPLPGNHTFVFSAYLDNLYKDGYKELKILGMTLVKKNNLDLHCFVRFKRTKNCITLPATVEKFRNPFGKRYVSAVFSCQLPISDIPAAVSLINNGDKHLLNKLVVMADPTENPILVKPPLKFISCIAPLHQNYSDLNQLVQAVEFNRLLGSDLFVFYNHSASRTVSNVLEDLVAEGIAEVIQWQLPTAHIHYYGQFIAANDCIFRNAKRAKYVVNTDLDEFLIPRKASDWVKLEDRVLQKYPNAGAFVVRTTHFYITVANHTNELSKNKLVKRYNILPLLNTNRTDWSWHAGFLSKLIVRPDRVSHMAIHIGYGLKGTFSSETLSVDDAMVHHYSLRTKFPKEKEGFRTDMFVYKYKDKLLRNIVNRWEKIHREYEL